MVITYEKYKENCKKNKVDVLPEKEWLAFKEDFIETKRQIDMIVKYRNRYIDKLLNILERQSNESRT